MRIANTKFTIQNLARYFSCVLLTACYALLTPSPLRADLRDYLLMYKPYAIPKGEIEIELWTDIRSPEVGDNYLWHQTEVEYGFRPNHTMAFYSVFQEGLGFTGVKWANRFYLGTYLDQWPVDLGTYVELVKANDSKMPDELEVKLLANKKLGDIDITANPILELENETEIKNGQKEKEWELEGSLRIGFTYPLNKLLLAENDMRGSKFALELALGENVYLVPQVNLTLAPYIRLNIGPAIGLSSGADDLQIKSIFEVEF